MRCSCPDWTDMCKHTSAVLYGVGARLDAEPDLLFALRGVDRSDLDIAAPGGVCRSGKPKSPRNAPLLTMMSLRCSASNLSPHLLKSGSKDPDTGLKSGISGRTKRATPFNRAPAQEPIPVNSNSARTKPTPTRSKDAKISPVSSGARPQTTDANANRAEAQIARGKTRSATSAIGSPRKARKQDVAASRQTGCAAIGTEIPSWRSNNCREMDEVEKAEGPRFLSVGPVPDSQRATLSNLDPSQKRATLRCGGGRPLTMRSEKN